MSPKGVEHQLVCERLTGQPQVIPSMSPKGVEHSVRERIAAIQRV